MLGINGDRLENEFVEEKIRESTLTRQMGSSKHEKNSSFTGRVSLYRFEFVATNDVCRLVSDNQNTTVAADVASGLEFFSEDVSFRYA